MVTPWHTHARPVPIRPWGAATPVINEVGGHEFLPCEMDDDHPTGLPRGRLAKSAEVSAVVGMISKPFLGPHERQEKRSVSKGLHDQQGRLSEGTWVMTGVETKPRATTGTPTSASGRCDDAGGRRLKRGRLTSGSRRLRPSDQASRSPAGPAAQTHPPTWSKQDLCLGL